MSFWQDLAFWLLGAAVFSVFGVGIVSFFACAYHFLRWCGEPKGKTESTVAGLLGPFSVLAPGLFTRKGQTHLSKMAFYLLLFLICFSVLMLFKWATESA